MSHNKIKLNLDNAYGLTKLKEYQDDIATLHAQIHKKEGMAVGHSAWLDLPNQIKDTDIDHIQDLACEIRQHAKHFIVVGIGGSYLASKAAIEAIHPSYGFPFSNKNINIIHAGHHLDSVYHQTLLSYLDQDPFYIHLISKSGKTLESLLIFKILKQKLEQNLGKEKARQYIIVTTESMDNPVGAMALKEGYRVLLMNSALVGRYSILSSVGLLPMAVSGISIRQLINGARDSYNATNQSELFKNDAYLYALTRHLLYENGKKCEFLIYYQAALEYFSRWWQQLFSESLGKNKKGLLCCTSLFTSDLHSLGQWIQEGDAILFETILQIQQLNSNLRIPIKESPNIYTSSDNQLLQHINHEALKGTKEAHIKAGIPLIVIQIPELNAYYLGQLIYFFQKACVMNGYLMNVNPFTQPGVEQYKIAIKKRLELL